MQSFHQNPEHVAIIMDGNGRWARQKGLPRIEGHRRGLQAVREVVEAAGKIQLRYLSLYAFSVENWQRPASEVKALMVMLKDFLRKETAKLIENRIQLKSIGRIQDLPPEVQRALAEAEESTRHFDEHHLILALNYGARTEIADAFQSYAEAVAQGRETPANTDWATVRKYLYTASIPDPDLLIRTSGEYRLSNFLLLQCAYTEMIFSPVLWPDFRKRHFHELIDEYKRRERRFGRTGEQVGESAAAESLLSQ